MDKYTLQKCEKTVSNKRELHHKYEIMIYHTPYSENYLQLYHRGKECH